MDSELIKIRLAKHHSPFSVLGMQRQGSDVLIRVYIPHCNEVCINDTGTKLERIPNTDFFEYRGPCLATSKHYQLLWTDKDNNHFLEYDPYSFPVEIPEFDLKLFEQGQHWHIYRVLGAHSMSIDGVEGVRFAVWAPNAGRVSVIGDFNRWDGRRHPMQNLGASGVWCLFIPGLGAGELYKFELRDRDSETLFVKSDPYAQLFENRPKTASIVAESSQFTWNDSNWMSCRKKADSLHEPVSIYEVHLGSWQRDDNNQVLNYRELAHRLCAYVKLMGFTHIELLPISEHPYDESWGYQVLGYFAPTARYGSPDEFRYFVDYFHSHNIGVILDWVPAHFPKDEHGLAKFDGTALYEHEDSRLGEHPDWGTLIFNYSRNEVRNFLTSSAVYWFEEFHVDGLRVDAVASLLYLDYSREEGEWLPNKHGGNENLEAISFIQELNAITHSEFPGTMIVAEESTAWPQVTRPTWAGGLGFTMKWNMGWMHDTLQYMSNDPVHRKYYHENLSFGLLYAFTENFVLPISHDEVVHGKSSLLNKMPGDEWQKFANLRLLYTYMFTYPGKKLLFMGCEFAQKIEWDAKKALEWYLLDYPLHQGVQNILQDLNSLYKQLPELYQHDVEADGFQWIDCHDHEKSIISYMRKFENRLVVVILNFTPVPRNDYCIGVPNEGEYKEILNSDSEYYSGSNFSTDNLISTDNIESMGLPYSLKLKLPPLGGIILTPTPANK